MKCVGCNKHIVEENQIFGLTGLHREKVQYKNNVTFTKCIRFAPVSTRWWYKLRRSANCQCKTSRTPVVVVIFGLFQWKAHACTMKHSKERMIVLPLRPRLYSHLSNERDVVVYWCHKYKPFCSRMTETTSGWLWAMAMCSGVCRATPRVSSGKAFWVWRLGLAPCWSSSAVRFAKPQRQAVWRGLSPWK